MATSKSVVTPSQFAGVFYRPSLFRKGSEVSSVSAAVTAGIVLLVISLFNAVKSAMELTSFTAIQAFFSTFLLVPLGLLVLYGLFFVVIKAFDEKIRRGFWNGYLVFSLISLLFLFVGHVLNLLLSAINVYTLTVLALTAFVVYYLVFLVLHLKNFLETSWYRVVVSFFIVDVFLLVLSIAQYLSFLVSSLA